MTYWKVPREWTGETVFILGCGPSIKDFDATVLQGHGHVVAINDSFILAPNADVLYFPDEPWYRMREVLIGNFKGQYVVTLENTQVQRVFHLRNAGVSGLETDPGALRHGYNGGYQAINLAYHFGASRIVLLGYDMKIGQKGELRWNNRPGWQYAPDKFNGILQSFIPWFEYLKVPLEEAGVEVINCTPDSALKTWPNRPLEEVLNLRHECRTGIHFNGEVVPL